MIPLRAAAHHVPPPTSYRPHRNHRHSARTPTSVRHRPPRLTRCRRRGRFTQLNDSYALATAHHPNAAPHAHTTCQLLRTAPRFNTVAQQQAVGWAKANHNTKTPIAVRLSNTENARAIPPRAAAHHVPPPTTYRPHRNHRHSARTPTSALQPRSPAVGGTVIGSLRHGLP